MNIVSAEIDKSMNGKNVKCWASNKIQNKPYETEEVHTLNVHCKYPIVPGSHITTIMSAIPCSDAPTFTKEPADVSTDPGKKVTLECEADGNPAPTYAWFR